MKQFRLTKILSLLLTTKIIGGAECTEIGPGDYAYPTSTTERFLHPVVAFRRWGELRRTERWPEGDYILDDYGNIAFYGISATEQNWETRNCGVYFHKETNAAYVFHNEQCRAVRPNEKGGIDYSQSFRFRYTNYKKNWATASLLDPQEDRGFELALSEILKICLEQSTAYTLHYEGRSHKIYSPKHIAELCEEFYQRENLSEGEYGLDEEGNIFFKTKQEFVCGSWYFRNNKVVFHIRESALRIANGQSNMFIKIDITPERHQIDRTKSFVFKTRGDTNNTDKCFSLYYEIPESILDIISICVSEVRQLSDSTGSSDDAPAEIQSKLFKLHRDKVCKHELIARNTLITTWDQDKFETVFGQGGNVVSKKWDPLVQSYVATDIVPYLDPSILNWFDKAHHQVETILPVFNISTLTYNFGPRFLSPDCVDRKWYEYSASESEHWKSRESVSRDEKFWTLFDMKGNIAYICAKKKFSRLFQRYVLKFSRGDYQTYLYSERCLSYNNTKKERLELPRDVIELLLQLSDMCEKSKDLDKKEKDQEPKDFEDLHKEALDEFRRGADDDASDTDLAQSELRSPEKILQMKKSSLPVQEDPEHSIVVRSIDPKNRVLFFGEDHSTKLCNSGNYSERDFNIICVEENNDHCVFYMSSNVSPSNVEFFVASLNEGGEKFKICRWAEQRYNCCDDLQIHSDKLVRLVGIAAAKFADEGISSKIQTFVFNVKSHLSGKSISQRLAEFDHTTTPDGVVIITKLNDNRRQWRWHSKKCLEIVYGPRNVVQIDDSNKKRIITEFDPATGMFEKREQGCFLDLEISLYLQKIGYQFFSSPATSFGMVFDTDEETVICRRLYAESKILHLIDTITKSYPPHKPDQINAECFYSQSHDKYNLVVRIIIGGATFDILVRDDAMYYVNPTVKRGLKYAMFYKGSNQGEFFIHRGSHNKMLKYFKQQDVPSVETLAAPGFNISEQDHNFLFCVLPETLRNDLGSIVAQVVENEHRMQTGAAAE